MTEGRYGKYGETRRLLRLRPSAWRGVRRPVSPPKDAPPHAAAAARPRRIDIREALAVESRFVEKLSGRVFQPYGTYGRTIRGWIDSGQALTLIALFEGHAAGFAMTARLSPEPDAPGGTELLAIAVHPKRRRCGIGRLLLQRIEEEMKGLGAHILWLHTATVNQAARRLFESQGYRMIHLKRRFYPRGQDALLMAKRLADGCS